MRTIFLIFCVALASLPDVQAQVLWENPITGSNPNTSNPYTSGQVVAANLTVSGIGRGPGIDGNAANNRYNANGWNTSALDPNGYFYFTLTPAPGHEMDMIDFTYTGQRNNASISNFAIRSSLDGYSANIGTPTDSGATIDLSAAPFQNLTGPVTFRFYAWGADTPTRTFSINDFVFRGTVSTPTVDWANLQFPGTATINQGTNVTFYAQCYEPGATPGAGAGAGITAWIGYSASDTSPDSASWTWIPATYNVDSGNNDEYSATFGASLPEGTYYVASRFQLNSGSYVYGGFHPSGGHFWNGTTYRSALLTVNGPNTVDWGNLQSPPNGSLVLGGVFNVYAQVYEPGITDFANNQGEGIQVWIGYSTSNNNPGSAGWTWTLAEYNPFGGGAANDEYMLDIGSVIPDAGTYYYASRFQLDDGPYRYGGIQASGINGNFWDGTEFISGVLTVTLPPMQEISVRGHTGGTNPIVDGSTTPNGLNNTVFPATEIGSSTTKDYRVTNDGTATLTLSGTPRVMISGAHASDFTVTTMPAATVAPGMFTTFVITFSPLQAGTRNATVTIVNNDLDENPFDFAIRGAGICDLASNTVTPTSGPVGTEVTVTATTNNLTGATAMFNGIPATVIPVSPSVIKVIVPPGAVSGNLVTINAQGCTATTSFAVTDNVVGGCQGSGGSTPSDLFISQVADSGADGLSYIEIYNGTGATVNLASYSLRFHNNGSSGVNGGNISLNNFNLPNNQTYVVATGMSSLSCTSVAGGNGELADQTSSTGGINFKNGSDNNNLGHDHIRLYRGTTHVDSWGVFEDQSWAIPLNLDGEGANFSRKNTAVAPSTTFSISDWDVVDWGNECSDLDFSDIDAYDYSAGLPPVIVTHPAYSASCTSTVLSVSATEGFAGGNPLAYQWYVAAPGSTNWTPVTNSGVFSGATTADLSISDVSGFNDYQFYVEVQENTASCYTASNAVKISEVSVSWTGSAWVPAAPGPGDVAVIDGHYDTSSHGSFEACSVIVHSGNTLTISANEYISIRNDLTVDAGATVHVLNQGSLVMIEDSGTVTNNGTMLVERTTSPYNKYDYTYWSSPVTSSTIGAAFPGWRTDYSFVFNTSAYADVIAPFDGFDDDNNAWQYAGATATMLPGKGYAVMAPTTGSFPATSTVVFSGTVNNGVISTPLALSGNPSDPNDDFVLIGNPYPSAIFADDFINANPNFAGTLYFWTHRTGISPSNPGPDTNNFITTDYAMYNLSGGTSSGTGSPPPSGYVASGQGFFVEAESATPITFNNSMRDRLHANHQFYRTQQLGEAQKDRIWINMENSDGLFSQILIGYFSQATLDVDRGYDGVVNRSSNSVSLYSFIGSAKFRIQGRPEFDAADMVPLGYSTSIPGIYTISIDTREGQLNLPDREIYLEDKWFGISHDLRQGGYSFTSDAGEFNDRFLLRYTSALGIIDPMLSSDVIAYPDGGSIYIKSAVEEVAHVDLFDVAGRLIYSAHASGREAHIAAPGVARQALIVRITLRNGQVVAKKLIL